MPGPSSGRAWSLLRYVVSGLAAGALLGALAVYLALRWYRQRTGFAVGGQGSGRIVASDTGVEESVLLRDPQLGLRGRPDYLLEFEVAGHPLFVPLELKPGRRSRRIYESDALQVARDITPPNGIICVTGSLYLLGEVKSLIKVV